MIKYTIAKSDDPIGHSMMAKILGMMLNKDQKDFPDEIEIECTPMGSVTDFREGIFIKGEDNAK